MTGIPELNIYEAVDHFSGGVYRPSAYDSKWNGLQSRLDSCGYTGGEFCYFMINKYNNLKPDESRLIKKNLMCCDKAWEAFIRYREKLPRELAVLMKLEMGELKARLEYGFSLERLLGGNVHPFNPAVRVDRAIKAVLDGEFDSSPIINKYRQEAYDVVVGCPSILMFTPFLAKIMKSGDFNEFCRH